MIKMGIALALAGTGSSAALAANTLATAPAPTWVKPVAVPKETGDKSSAKPDQPDQAAIRVLLQDQQVDLQPGRMTRYFENVMRIQTPQGLSAGNVSLAWNPDTDVATVHKLLILRGDKVIDVLAAGQSFTTMRRETNLESAMLDGVLTASIQPEGLQVGDVIDFAASVSQSDPALKNHVEQIGGGWNGMAFDRAHLRVQWPSDVPVRVRGTTGLPPLKVERKGGLSSIELSLDTLPPLPTPKGAPPRYAIMRVAEVSDFASWADLSALMAPLYDKAATLPDTGFLKKEIATIAAASPDPKTRAEAALALVQDRVRYVFLGMNDGGLVPADAETTWSRRFGDCKGKTVLLLALLKGLGIEAEPVIVSIGGGDGLDQRLPMVGLFNHVLVRATIAGRTYWLDGTRTGDKALDRILTPHFLWGLPLAPGATLVRMVAPPPDQPQSETAIRIDATAGLSVPAPIHAETVLRDDAAVGLNQQLANLTPDVRDRGLREYWRNRYDFVDVTSTTASFDPSKREERLVMDGKAKMDWSTSWYETDGVRVGYKADFTRDDGPNKDAPFLVAYPYYSRSSETILLPPGAFAVDHGEPIDVTVAGLAYHRTTKLEGNRFTVEETERGVQQEFPAADAPAAQAKLRDLASKTVFLHKPADYAATDKEIAAVQANTPTTASGFVDRGNMLLNRNRFDDAIADFNKALALNPKDATALADRGICYIWKDDPSAAARDLDAAEKLDPRNVGMLRGKGFLAQVQSRPEDGISYYSRSLEVEPNSAFAIGHRAELYAAVGNYDQALVGSAAAIERDPSWTNLYLMRANIFYKQGRLDDARGEAVALAKANPGNGLAHITAARILAKIGRNVEAAQEFDAALKLGPNAYVYLNRAQSRPRSDLVGRQADLDEAIKLEPKSPDILIARANLHDERKAYADALVSWNAAVAADAVNIEALIGRGVDQARLGHTVLADKDFAAARAAAKTADQLNEFCWLAATHSVVLDQALESCKAAVALTPASPAMLDSLGFVLMRLGRLDDAVASYTKALEKAPKLAASLYGLYLIEMRKGDTAKAEAHRQAALKVDPDVADEFKRFGV